MEKYDLIIVGAGPAGIFTAVELLRRGSNTHNDVISGAFRAQCRTQEVHGVVADAHEQVKTCQEHQKDHRAREKCIHDRWLSL